MRRNNLIDLFLRGTEMDEYLADHQYGRKKYTKVKRDGRKIVTGEATLLEHQITQLELFERSIYIDEEIEEMPVPKMSAFATYIAIMKGYCALMILVLPKAFMRGGWAFSAGVMSISAFVQIIAALKLVDVGLDLNITSYERIAQKALGNWARTVTQMMILLTQFSFAMSLITFITTAW